MDDNKFDPLLNDLITTSEEPESMLDFVRRSGVRARDVGAIDRLIQQNRERETNELLDRLHAARASSGDPVEEARKPVRKLTADRERFHNRFELTEVTSLTDLLAEVSRRSGDLGVRALCGQLIELAGEFGEA